MVDFETKEKYDFNDLLRIMEILRAPEAVCGTANRIIIPYAGIS